MQNDNPLKDFSTLGVHPFKQKVKQIYALAIQNNHAESEVMDELNKVMEKFKKKVVHPDTFVKIQREAKEAKTPEELRKLVDDFKAEYPDDLHSKMFLELSAFGIAKVRGWMDDDYSKGIR